MSFVYSLDQSWFIRGITTLGDNSTPQSEVNRNIEVTVFPDWFKKVTLEWKIPASWGNCTFHVYFWPIGTADYERLTSSALDSPSFLDPRSQEYSKFRDGYYIVEALLPGRNLRVKSLPTSAKYKRRSLVELKAAEIQRREYLLLSKFAGVKSYVFRKRMYGQRCHRCWNSESEKVLDDRCPVCYGTSFEGGYFTPIPSFIQFDPTPNSSTKTYFGNLETNQIGGWTISIPEISSDDIIIRTGDWNVYKVIRVSTTELQTVGVRQMMTLTQLSRNDIENQLALKTEDPAASQYLPSIGGKYAETRLPTNQIDTNVNNDPTWFAKQKPQIMPEKYKV